MPACHALYAGIPMSCKASISYLVCSYPKDLYSQHVLPCLQVPQDL